MIAKIVFSSRDYLIRVWWLRFGYDKLISYTSIDVGWVAITQPIIDQIIEDMA